MHKQWKALEPYIVTNHEVAKSVGVLPSAFSNWLARWHADCPEPLGYLGGSTLWYLGDVDAWLKRHGKTPDWAIV
jgi:hypothetical protein